MIAGYGLVSFGELLTNGLAFAVVARYVPRRLSALMMGTYLVAAGVAFYVGSLVANWAAIPARDSGGPVAPDPRVSLGIYDGLFGRLLMLALLVVAVCAALLPLLRRLDRAHHGAAAPVPVEPGSPGGFQPDEHGRAT